MASPFSASVLYQLRRTVKMRSRIIGIDFSGAKDGLKKIWLAEGWVYA
jgi:hypothetical protein